MKTVLKKCRTLLFMAVLVFSLFAPVINVYAEESYIKGQVIDSVNEGGQLVNEGDVKITKTVEAVAGTSGQYKITIKVSGLDYKSETTSVVPVYVSVVFDRSGSMGSSTKWNSAVDGAKTFASDLLSRIPDAYLNLVTFGGSTVDSTAFSNSDFSSANFGTASGGTNLDQGIAQAISDLSTAPSNAKKYIVVISDGVPNSQTTAKAQADIAKAAGIEVYAIGYEVTTSAENFLKNSIASTPANYYSADPTSVSLAFSNIAKEVSRVPAGTDAVVTDTLGDGFTFVSSDDSNVIVNGKTITYNLGEITETGQEFSFIVEIDDEISEGIYETNNVENQKVNVTYKTPNGNDVTVAIGESSKVYWKVSNNDDTTAVSTNETGSITPPKTGVTENTSLLVVLNVILGGSVILKKKYLV